MLSTVAQGVLSAEHHPRKSPSSKNRIIPNSLWRPHSLPLQGMVAPNLVCSIPCKFSREDPFKRVIAVQKCVQQRCKCKGKRFTCQEVIQILMSRDRGATPCAQGTVFVVRTPNGTGSNGKILLVTRRRSTIEISEYIIDLVRTRVSFASPQVSEILKTCRW